jgi:nitroreductase
VTHLDTSAKTATTTTPVHPILATRWSPRAFDRTHALDERTLTALLEAARWAPSANNSQPWRFLVTRRDEGAFDALTDMLAPGNRAWAPAASALLLVAAETTDEAGRPRPWALYDTGQAVAALSVQAESEGLSVHQLGGFDAEAVRHRFDLADTLTPVVVVAIGRRDPHVELPEPLAAREVAPRTREPLAGLLLDEPEDAREVA